MGESARLAALFCFLQSFQSFSSGLYGAVMRNEHDDGIGFCFLLASKSDFQGSDKFKMSNSFFAH